MIQIAAFQLDKKRFCIQLKKGQPFSTTTLPRIQRRKKTTNMSWFQNLFSLHNTLYHSLNTSNSMVCMFWWAKGLALVMMFGRPESRQYHCRATFLYVTQCPGLCASTADKCCWGQQPATLSPGSSRGVTEPAFLSTLTRLTSPAQSPVTSV